MKLVTAPRTIQIETPDGCLIPLMSLCSIGRERTNTVVPACRRVSRRHAIIRRDSHDRCILIDLGSSNGTYVNGQRVTHSIELNNGDLIQVGSERLTLRISESEPRPQQPADDSSTFSAHPGSFVPCWLLLGDTSGLDSHNGEDSGSEEDCYKTQVGWLQVSHRIVERRGGHIADPADYKLLAYWPDAGRTAAVAAAVADVLRQLHATQVRAHMEFRLALHFGSVMIGEERAQGRKAIIGTEVSVAMRMQTLAWKLSLPCLISEEAHRRISQLVTATPLSQSNEPAHRFFSLAA